ncbi:uncharacterized protein [Diadema antillarum]|uniref:uncharacterized protein n=1 Tax=Diadema antillarum TaxID=105358 RepID=UPI003A8BF283
MSVSVQGSSSDSEMVKPLITRKSRQFQTAVERWNTLRQSSSRSFDRLNLRNRFEEDRLTRKHRRITDLSDAQLKELFRVKNEMRVALLDIAKSKRQYVNSESEFESKLRSGRRSPVFQKEYQRLKHKQLELDKLSEQLKGPNAKLLALNLSSELKNVEMKALREASRKEGKYKGKWLAPLKNLQQAKASDSAETKDVSKVDTDAASNPPPSSDLASLVKLVHKEFKRASISERKDTEPAVEMNDERKDDESEKSHGLSERSPRGGSQTTTSPGLFPVSRPPKSLIPLNSGFSPPSSAEASADSELVEGKRKKRERKETIQSLPSVPELNESAPPTQPHSPKPPTKRKKKQRLRLPDIQGPTKPIEVSRTESARRRDRMMQKRLSNLAAKTKEDIKNRRSVSPDETMNRASANEALNSIHQAEVVARLQLARSKVGIVLPELADAKTMKKSVTRRSRGKRETSVSLPPVNVEGRLLRELKEQRRKHKHHSSGLPKLP